MYIHDMYSHIHVQSYTCTCTGLNQGTTPLAANSHISHRPRCKNGSHPMYNTLYLQYSIMYMYMRCVHVHVHGTISEPQLRGLR